MKTSFTVRAIPRSNTAFLTRSSIRIVIVVAAANPVKEVAVQAALRYCVAAPRYLSIPGSSPTMGLYRQGGIL
jgi:hypothetical protein